jgi:hypothetical protein
VERNLHLLFPVRRVGVRQPGTRKRRQRQLDYDQQYFANLFTKSGAAEYNYHLYSSIHGCTKHWRSTVGSPVRLFRVVGHIVCKYFAAGPYRVTLGGRHGERHRNQFAFWNIMP